MGTCRKSAVGLLCKRFCSGAVVFRRRLIRTLPQGLAKGEPLYFSHLALETVIFSVLGMNLAEPLWPWLSGQGGQVEILRVVANIVAFAACVLSWQYVKQATNRCIYSFPRLTW
jgi:hypothetical protein